MSLPANQQILYVSEHINYYTSLIRNILIPNRNDFRKIEKKNVIFFFDIRNKKL